MKTLHISFMKAAVTVAAAFALAALGPAPIRGDKLGVKPHTNLQAQDEKTLQEEQHHQMRMGQVGTTTAPHAEKQMDTLPGAHDAVSVLAAAQKATAGSNGSQGAQVLKAANDRLNSGSGHSWLWALLVLGGVIGGVFGVKRWADNNIPNMPTVAPKRDGW